MAGFADAFAKQIANALSQDIRSIITELQTSKMFTNSRIDLQKVYTAQEVAGILGTKRKESVYEIPQSELPRVRRVGKHFGYLGINVLCYMHSLPPVDMKATIESYRERLKQERTTVIPLRPVKKGKTRVL